MASWIANKIRGLNNLRRNTSSEIENSDVNANPIPGSVNFKNLLFDKTNNKSSDQNSVNLNKMSTPTRIGKRLAELDRPYSPIESIPSPIPNIKLNGQSNISGDSINHRNYDISSQNPLENINFQNSLNNLQEDNNSLNNSFNTKSYQSRKMLPNKKSHKPNGTPPFVRKNLKDQITNPHLEFFKTHWEQIKSIIIGSKISQFSSNHQTLHNWQYQNAQISNSNSNYQNSIHHNSSYCAQANEVSAFGLLLEKMVCLLVDEEKGISITTSSETDENPAEYENFEMIGPILEYSLKQEIFDLLNSWSNQPTNPLQIQILIELLKMYETIVNEAQLNVLHQWPVVDNMMKLLRTKLTMPTIMNKQTDELDMHIVTLIRRIRI